MTADWKLDLDVGDAAAMAVFGQDRAWCGYAIADLDPALRHYTRVATAYRDGGGAAENTAAALLYQHPAFQVLVTTGAAAGVAAILEAMPLPPRFEISVRPEHLPALRRHCRVEANTHEMLRMYLDGRDSQSAGRLNAAASVQPPPSPLSIADAPDLIALYQDYPENAFHPDQLGDGAFYGIRHDGKLVAAGGTHVVSLAQGVAAVGSIFTRPEARGQGLARAITAAVCLRLIAAGCPDIVLNVAVENSAARRVYTSLGFTDHCQFWEGHAQPA